MGEWINKKNCSGKNATKEIKALAKPWIRSPHLAGAEFGSVNSFRLRSTSGLHLSTSISRHFVGQLGSDKCFIVQKAYYKSIRRKKKKIKSLKCPAQPLQESYPSLPAGVTNSKPCPRVGGGPANSTTEGRTRTVTGLPLDDGVCDDFWGKLTALYTWPTLILSTPLSTNSA